MSVLMFELHVHTVMPITSCGILIGVCQKLLVWQPHV